MARKGLNVWLHSLIILAATFSLQGGFPSLTRNDPLPFFSNYYPYSYLSQKQKAALMAYSYAYAENRFRVSLSAYGQFATRARDSEAHTINIGDINGRWNMLGLFYDQKMRDVLYPVLGMTPPTDGPDGTNPCKSLIENPIYVDPNQEFGFFTIPVKYQKFGVRLESELLLIDRCYYAVGLRVQWGITDVRQNLRGSFEADDMDLTGQALGRASPGAQRGLSTSMPPTTLPLPQPPIAVAPPYINALTSPVPPCPMPINTNNCVEQIQPFVPCDTETWCFAFPATCKQTVIENIMKQTDIIANILGLDVCNYHKIGMDDLRLSLFWRQIFIMNEDDERYPRLLFMPFLELGVGIPMTKEIPNNKMFAVPIGNNHHTYAGGKAGFTIDFLDTIDIYAAGGFSYFLKRDYCNYRMPTSPAESGIFPYCADVNLKPGTTWNFDIGMNAYHFLENLTFWGQYSYVSHAQDKIVVCKSFIPEGSQYYYTGFDVERAECFSKWESQLFTAGFNYDLTDNFSFGVLWQGPLAVRNAYRPGTWMGTITFVY